MNDELVKKLKEVLTPEQMYAIITSLLFVRESTESIDSPFHYSYGTYGVECCTRLAKELDL